MLRSFFALAALAFAPVAVAHGSAARSREERCLRMVPLARLERALFAELDFESSASTNSATGAGLRYLVRSRAGGNRPPEIGRAHV